MNLPLLLIGGFFAFMFLSKPAGAINVLKTVAPNVEFSGFSIKGFSGGLLELIVRLTVTNVSSDQLNVKAAVIYVNALGSTIFKFTPTADELKALVIAPKTQSTLSFPVKIPVANLLKVALNLADIKSLLINGSITITGFVPITIKNYEYPFDGSKLVSDIYNKGQQAADSYNKMKDLISKLSKPNTGGGANAGGGGGGSSKSSSKGSKNSKPKLSPQDQKELDQIQADEQGLQTTDANGNPLPEGMFIDPDGMLIDADGNYLDENGFRTNATDANGNPLPEGVYMDQFGETVTMDGQAVDENGYITDATTPTGDPLPDGVNMDVYGDYVNNDGQYVDINDPTTYPNYDPSTDSPEYTSSDNYSNSDVNTPSYDPYSDSWANSDGTPTDQNGGDVPDGYYYDQGELTNDAGTVYNADTGEYNYDNSTEGDNSGDN